jgi:parvulin-like peptidyl-prolyl isomerase
MALLNGVSIDDTRVVTYLKHELKIKNVYQQILYRQIIDRAATEREITVSAEEVQVAADQFRYQHKLESASQTFDWLNEQLLTANDWEAGIQKRLLARKLAEWLFKEQVTTYFNQNKIQYEKVVLYRIIVPYKPLAQEIFYQIEEEELSFFEAAHLYDLDERRRLACGFEGKLSRWQLKPDITAQVFGAAPREVIGLVESELGYEILMVEEFIPAELTTEVYQHILDLLFHEWLESELNYFIHNDNWRY